MILLFSLHSQSMFWPFMRYFPPFFPSLPYPIPFSPFPPRSQGIYSDTTSLLLFQGQDDFDEADMEEVSNSITPLTSNTRYIDCDYYNRTVSISTTSYIGYSWRRGLTVGSMRI